MRRLVALALVLAAPASAGAAEPESGTVSSTAPKVDWTGTLTRPYMHHNVFNYEPTAGFTGTVPCAAPACDTFTLEVADSANLKITVVSEQTEDMSLRIQKPDGEWEYHAGWGDGTKATTVNYKNAAKGTYVVNVVARVFGTTQPTAVEDTADYAGSAVLALPPPVVEPPPAVTPPAPAPKATPRKKAGSKATCRRKAKKIRNAKKRKAALKRCARRR